MIIDETPKYRKKRKKNTPEKSDHKHDYLIEVLVEKEFKDRTKRYHYGRQCSICGKLGHEKIIETELEPCSNSLYRMLNQEEILEKYKGLKIIKELKT